MLSKEFLLAQYEDWTRHLVLLNDNLEFGSARDRAAEQERVEKAGEWLSHYARLLHDGHGVQVGR